LRILDALLNLEISFPRLKKVKILEEIETRNNEGELITGCEEW